MTKAIYLDNGSTSFPKAPGVGDVMKHYIEHEGVNIARGTYATAYHVAGRVLTARERLAALFGFAQPQNVVFTSGVTASLNYIMKGLLRPGDHVLTSSMEHNAVMRPLRQLEKHGVQVEKVPCTAEGDLMTDHLEEMLRPNTRLVVMTHASNVCGTVMPLRDVGGICRRHGVLFAVDAAQTAGVVPIDMEEMCIDALAFTGHKGLLGPQGTGGFVVRDEMAAQMEALLSGGTGSRSHLEEVPDFMPDKFEPGTANLPGILGLEKALVYIEETGVEAIGARERELAMRLIRGVEDVPGVRIVGKRGAEGRIGVVSLDFPGQDNAEVAYLLESEYGIMTRCGLHCAPSAHQTLGTFPGGTVRFVPGHTTTEAEIDTAVDAIRTAAGV